MWNCLHVAQAGICQYVASLSLADAKCSMQTHAGDTFHFYTYRASAASEFNEHK